MRIVADENIPFVREAFGQLGQVTTMPGRDITCEQIRDADILLVRSVTKVGRELLAGSAVRFVATATIGFDHIERDYLAKHEIGFARAPGSNANSVSEWVTCALLRVATDHGFILSGKTLGIVGMGNVGSRVATKARALGLNLLLNDPPRARQESGNEFVALPELLRSSDMVTVHVPLNRSGKDKTLNLVEREFLLAMKPGAFFLNSSRGQVVCEDELRAALASRRIAHAVLDVWQNEPEISLATLQAVDLATPHIAGYSFDGKVEGTRMIYQAACEYFNLEATWDSRPLLPVPEVPVVNLDFPYDSHEQALAAVVSKVYDIRTDHVSLLKLCGLPAADSGPYFTKLRKNYPRRREFQHTRVHMDTPDHELADKLRGLGFVVQ